MRKGVALMITLMVIVVLGELIYLSFSYIEKAKNNSNSVEQLMQINLIADDMVGVIETTVKNIKTSDDLEFLYMMPLALELKNEKAMVTIETLPNSAVINLNNLVLKNGDVADKYEQVWLNILDKYEVKDPFLLTELVVGRISKKTQGNKKLLTMEGNLTERAEFDEILENYYTQSEDKIVFSIEWEDYIGFGNENIDFNFMKPTLLALMNDMIDLETAKKILDGTKFYGKLEDINLENDIITQLKEFPFLFFHPSFRCSCIYNKEDLNMEFVFDFDKNRGVSNFKILGKL